MRRAVSLSSAARRKKSGNASSYRRRAAGARAGPAAVRLDHLACSLYVFVTVF